MEYKTVTFCDNCPLWNNDRDYCQHPNRTISEFMASPTQEDYFAECPLKDSGIQIQLNEPH